MTPEAITILDTYGEGQPVIGTVLCKGHSKKNILERVTSALETHFDAAIAEVEIPWHDLEACKVPEQFEITVFRDKEQETEIIEIYSTQIL